MRSVAEVAAEHADAILALPRYGVAVINGDDAHADVWRDAALRAGAKIVAFGTRRDADVRADVTLHADGSTLELSTPAGAAELTLARAGTRDGAERARAVRGCAGGRRGARVGRARASRRSVRSRDGSRRRSRGQRRASSSTTATTRIPDSVRAAIDVLARARGERWLVLGDMGEVGDQGPAFHREVGEYARIAGLDRLFTSGALAKGSAAAFGRGAQHFDDVDCARRGARARRARGRHGAGEGLALHAHGTRRRRARRRHRGEALMLLWLTELLAKDIRAFNVFQYLTLRAVLACMTALVISFVIGPRMIAWLTRMKIGQSVRDDGPQTHLTKAGTPTMGGALILVAILITTLLWADLENRFVWVALLVTAGFGAIGWVDDYRKVVYRNPKGLSAKAKFFWQSVIGLVAAVYLAFSISAPDNVQFFKLLSSWVGSGFATSLSPKTDLIVPFFKTISYPLGVFGFIALSWCVIVGTSNAVNLTDGLDGLAIMPTVMVGSALGIFAYVTGNAVFAKYLQFPYIPGAGELAVICGAIAGAGLGFLWFNAYPAEVFMGDVGALGLGAALGTIAVIVRQEIVLLIMGGVFVVETLSVMVQVASFKLTGKRVFRMAPIHHHYELEGLEGEPGRRAVLDHHDAAGAVRSLHVETALTCTSKDATSSCSGSDSPGLSLARWLTRHGAQRARRRHARRAAERADALARRAAASPRSKPDRSRRRRSPAPT